MLRSAVTAVSAMALAIVPVAAQAAPQPAPRAPAATKEAQGLIGTTAWVLAAIGLGLAIWGFVEIIDDDEPASP